jgi:hypothetical protein
MSGSGSRDRAMQNDLPTLYGKSEQSKLSSEASQPSGFVPSKVARAFARLSRGVFESSCVECCRRMFNICINCPAGKFNFSDCD